MEGERGPIDAIQTGAHRHDSASAKDIVAGQASLVSTGLQSRAALDGRELNLAQDTQTAMEIVENELAPPDDTSDKLAWLNWVIAASKTKDLDEAALKALIDPGAFQNLGLCSASEWLTGMGLPPVYRCHFGKDEGYIRDSIKGAIKGEYIDFAEQVLLALDITYSRKSIANALDLARATADQRAKIARLEQEKTRLRT